MAQPVFDGHPLQEYFQDSGETSELMPGGIADVSLQPYLTDCPSTSKHSERMEKLCFLFFGAVESLSSFFSADSRMSLRTKAFAERFKYGVISSSLLSPAFATTSMVESSRRGNPTSLPGKLSNGHSRASSAADSSATDNLSMPPEHETPVWPLTLLFTVAVAALSARFYFVTFLLLAATLYYMHVHRLDLRSRPNVMTPSLLALQHLISAGHLWDSVINDTFTLLENEERSMFCGPASPLAPSSSIRVALSTSLLTTQTQCDNVRQLLSAITSPPELAQLAEMYAPPSPIKSTFLPTNNDRFRHRPLSHPGPSPCVSAAAATCTPRTDRIKKRSTWNGSYASLALVGSPPAFQLAQRREKRRSDLNVLLGTTSTSPTPARKRSRSTLSSPPQPLTDVSEEGEEDGMVTAESSSLAGGDEEKSFGAAALDLYRNRVQGGLRALELSPRRSPTTMSPGSKYTSMHTTTTRHHHPFSLSSLNHLLQNALASKRFACSHLLALRFEDDDDDVYWEDVRSVMSLLTSTLVDASSRLSEALDDLEEQQEHICRAESGLNTPDSPLASPPPPTTTTTSLSAPSSRPRPFLPLSSQVAAVDQAVSFAPTPTHLMRFASHVDAISSALDDAREQLTRCVASLKEEGTMRSPAVSLHSSQPSISSSGSGSGEPSTEHPAIKAYELLRRELGLALRECERGRDRLVCIVGPAPTTPLTDEEPSAEAEDRNGNDDRGQNIKGNEETPLQEDAQLRTVSPSPCTPDRDADADPGLDADVFLEIGLGIENGVEQVFEAESGSVGAFARERSKLSREERIRRAKAIRDGPEPGNDDPFRSHADAEQPTRWGPSGDVVHELRDVIYKVGQERLQRVGR